MSTTALRMTDAPEGLVVEGYSDSPADRASVANMVLAYIIDQWECLVAAARATEANEGRAVPWEVASTIAPRGVQRSPVQTQTVPAFVDDRGNGAQFAGHWPWSADEADERADACAPEAATPAVNGWVEEQHPHTVRVSGCPAPPAPSEPGAAPDDSGSSSSTD